VEVRGMGGGIASEGDHQHGLHEHCGNGDGAGSAKRSEGMRNANSTTRGSKWGGMEPKERRGEIGMQRDQDGVHKDA
jgi:hypothetical protein